MSGVSEPGHREPLGSSELPAGGKHPVTSVEEPCSPLALADERPGARDWGCFQHFPLSGLATVSDLFLLEP